MAHLEVEPKPSRPWWIWLLTAIILLALAALLLRKCDAEKSDAQRAAAKDTTATAIAATAPDWESVDFNAGTTTDADLNDKDITTRGNDTYTIYTLGENILFPTDGNDITENGKAKLKMISDLLETKYSEATIGVFGSADAIGSASDNKELGKARAAAVKNWLTTDGKIAASNISVQSLGETEPVATNQTSEGRQQNRNVSIVVFPKK